MLPVHNHLEPYDAITPIGGSPITFNLDTFDSSSFGYIQLWLNLMCRIDFNRNSEEVRPFKTQTAPVMSHQTSQQTVTPQPNLFECTPTLNFMPTFDPADDDEMEAKSPNGQPRITSRFILS